MNERIRELAEQSGWSEDIRYAPRAKEIEKFAELIVQESCSQIFTEVRDQRDQQFYDRVTANIKKHFGV